MVSINLVTVVSENCRAKRPAISTRRCRVARVWRAPGCSISCKSSCSSFSALMFSWLGSRPCSRKNSRDSFQLLRLALSSFSGCAAISKSSFSRSGLSAIKWAMASGRTTVSPDFSEMLSRMVWLKSLRLMNAVLALMKYRTANSSISAAVICSGCAAESAVFRVFRN